MASQLAIHVDGGTSHTRAWLVDGDTVLGEARADIGARDGAREGRALLAAAFVDLVQSLVARADSGSSASVQLVVAAGMIGSPQGLCEVPHVAAPADASTLAAGARLLKIAALGDLRCLFVPGVRTGASGSVSVGDAGAADLMRGEETLALGLLALGWLPPGGTLLSLGSHWKAIRIDGAGRVGGSMTTLSGERVAAVKRETILASALPALWPAEVEAKWVAAGAREAAAAGLGRALFCVRILEQRTATTPAARFAYLMGAAAAADRAVLVPSGVPAVTIVGAPAAAAAWTHVLRADDVAATVVAPADAERAFRAGCAAVARAFGARPVAPSCEEMVVV